MAYRLPQIRYRTQGFDVYSDSRHYEYYAAFECKSILAEDDQPLYFSSHFHVSKGVHQLEYENSIIQKCGRIGFLAVELRRSKGIRRSAFLVPWRTVMFKFQNRDKSLYPEDITYCCELDFSRGNYHITDEVKESYLKQIGAVTPKRKPFTRKKKVE